METNVEIKKVPIKVFDKPKGLIAVPFWVYIKIIGIELDAIKTSKPWSLVMGTNGANHHVDCWEIEKEELLKKMKEKNFHRESEWLSNSSIYHPKETLFFNINSCEPILSQ